MQHLSPEIYPWRRLPAVRRKKRTLLAQSSIEDEEGPAFASSSLPLQPTREEMAHLEAKYRDAIITPVGTARSVSQLDLSPTRFQRARSASVCSENLQLSRGNHKKRPSFRLPRHRASSVIIRGKKKSNGDSNGDRGVTTSVIDNILLRVKEQLARLSEEDRALQERMDRLSEDIQELSNKCERQRHQSTPMGAASISAEGSPQKQPLSLKTQCPNPQPPIPVLVVTDSISSKKLTDAWRDEYLKQVESHGKGFEDTDLNNVRMIKVSRSASNLSLQSGASVLVSETNFSGSNNELVTAN